MKKIFDKEKLILFFVILVQFVLAALAFFNYFVEPNFINVEKNTLYAIVLIIIVLINTTYLILLLNRVYFRSKKLSVKISSVMNNNIKDINIFGEVGVIFYDENYEIVWINEFLENRRLDMVGKNILEYHKDFSKIIEEKNESYKIVIDGMTYNSKCLKELKMVILKDVTEYEKIAKTYKEESPVVAAITMDNYSDVLSVLDEGKMAELEAKVRNALNEWAKDRRILLRKVRNDAYIAFLQESSFEVILKEKFSIVEKVRKLGDDENNLTISIGIGRGINDLLKLAEMSASAIDVALSRGGDQTVVNTYGKNMEFYGASGEARSKRHKVKVRVVSKSLSALIQSSRKIYIMGHIDADFDAIGAAVGIYSLSKQIKKEAKIIYEDKLVELKARGAFRQSFEKEEIDEMIIDANKAYEEITSEDLLILVDVSNVEITMHPKLCEKAERIAIIDHHRPAEKLMSQVFSYQESAASSTCEMVAEIVRYSEQKIRITPEAATLMLTGILLDTNNYKNKTGTRTYEASMILKEYGADNNVANDFLKEEFEEYQLKTKIQANSFTPYYGVVVCMAPEEDIVDKTYLAKVAQELLEVKGIKASFVLGYIKNEVVGISARSDGSINVQKIMESMGGGGHFSSAATQIQSSSLEEVQKELYLKLESYIGDNRLE